jgi:hypothetical protein
MPHAAVLDVGSDDRVILRSPYNPDVVQALKDTIPYAYREWDGAAKVWRIHPEWGDVLVQTLEAAGVRVLDKRPVVPLPVVMCSALDQACRQLFVTPDAPLEVAEAAFKALAKRYHPDVGGDTALFQALNDALATFKSYNEVPF